MLRGTRNPAARRAAKLAFGLRPPAVPNRARLHWAALVHAGASFTRPSRKPATNDKKCPSELIRGNIKPPRYQQHYQRSLRGH